MYNEYAIYTVVSALYSIHYTIYAMEYAFYHEALILNKSRPRWTMPHIVATVAPTSPNSNSLNNIVLVYYSEEFCDISQIII